MTAAAVIVPGVVWAVAAAILVALVWVVLRTGYRANQAALAQRGDWLRSYRKLEDANAAVICELESRPATYQTFPQELREEIYAARTGAAQLEGKG
jgi:hypothetical protein